MPKTFRLFVLTPEKEFHNDDVTQIVISTPEGDMGVLAEHMPIIAVVVESILKIEKDGAWREAAIGKGFLDLTSGVAELFVDSAEWAQDIDVIRSEAALDRAEERLLSDLSHTEHLRTHAAVARAKSRIKAAKAGVTYTKH